MNDEKIVIMSIKMPESLKEWYRVEAKNEGRQMSNLAAWVLTQYKKETDKIKRKKN